MPWHSAPHNPGVQSPHPAVPFHRSSHLQTAVSAGSARLPWVSSVQLPWALHLLGHARSQSAPVNPALQTSHATPPQCPRHSHTLCFGLSRGAATQLPWLAHVDAAAIEPLANAMGQALHSTGSSLCGAPGFPGTLQ